MKPESARETARGPLAKLGWEPTPTVDLIIAIVEACQCRVNKELVLTAPVTCRTPILILVGILQSSALPSPTHSLVGIPICGFVLLSLHFCVLLWYFVPSAAADLI